MVSSADANIAIAAAIATNDPILIPFVKDCNDPFTESKTDENFSAILNMLEIVSFLFPPNINSRRPPSKTSFIFSANCIIFFMAT